MTDIADTLDAIDDLATVWAAERDDRLQRRHLDPDDFRAVAETGFLRLIVPEAHGGAWRSLAETGPVLVDALGRLARGDHSVALVASMHPAVLVFWTAAPEAPEPHTEAWSEQRARIFTSAREGHFWGTVTSEPGSGGDILHTKTTATPVDEAAGVFELRGAKHFGSGSQVVSYMITTAKPVGVDLPLGFFIDLRDQPWDGTGGLTISHPWDGVGMKATQSHGVTLEGIHGTAWAWPESIVESAPYVTSLGLSMWVAIIVSILDQAMAETEVRLGGRALRPYEEVEWSRAEIDHWLIVQARDGLARTLAECTPQDAATAAVKAKIGVAELAETLLGRVSRAVGGSAYSGRSPFSSWYEDVRALGYLRPPWALAFDLMAEARRPDTE